MDLKELTALKSRENLSLIEEYNRMDPVEFSMKFGGDKNIPSRAIAEQIKYRKKAGIKFPSFNHTSFLYEGRAFEQSSSEVTAKYKSSFVSGTNSIDLTGGLGIDAIYISDNFKQCIYCETGQLLSSLFSHNVEELGKSRNISIHQGDGIEKLKEFPGKYFDWIYADPDRRAEGKRSVDLKYCSPDIPGNLDLFRSKGRNMLLKLSPAFDFQEAKRIFPDLAEYIVVSVNGECREVLLILDFENPTEDVLIKAAVLSENSKFILEEIETKIPGKKIAEIEKYFYEPDAAIIKAGLASKAADQFDLKFLNNEVDYLTGDIYAEDFPGRKFTVVETLEYKPGLLKKYLSDNNIQKANVAKRGFPLTVDEFRKKFRLKEGGDIYVFLTKINKGSLIAVFAKKQF